MMNTFDERQGQEPADTQYFEMFVNAPSTTTAVCVQPVRRALGRGRTPGDFRAPVELYTSRTTSARPTTSPRGNRRD